MKTSSINTGITYTFYPDKEGCKRLMLDSIEQNTLEEIDRLSILTKEQVIHFMRTINLYLNCKQEVEKLIELGNKGYSDDTIINIMSDISRLPPQN